MQNSAAPAYYRFLSLRFKENAKLRLTAASRRRPRVPPKCALQAVMGDQAHRMVELKKGSSMSRHQSAPYTVR